MGERRVESRALSRDAAPEPVGLQEAMISSAVTNGAGRSECDLGIAEN